VLQTWLIPETAKSIVADFTGGASFLDMGSLLMLLMKNNTTAAIKPIINILREIDVMFLPLFREVLCLV
jgi:hypothetical protein